MATTSAKATLPLILEDTYVRQDDHGRYSLNDLHQAAGGEDRHQPAKFMRQDQVQALMAELENSPDLASFGTAGIPAVKTKEGRGGGTFVARELVYAYAMWISPA